MYNMPKCLKSRQSHRTRSHIHGITLRSIRHWHNPHLVMSRWSFFVSVEYMLVDESVVSHKLDIFKIILINEESIVSMKVSRIDIPQARIRFKNSTKGSRAARWGVEIAYIFQATNIIPELQFRNNYLSIL